MSDKSLNYYLYSKKLNCYVSDNLIFFCNLHCVKK